MIEYIPFLMQHANNLGLRKTLALHFAETKQHRVAIEAICKQLDIYAKQDGCEMGIKTILNNDEKKIVLLRKRGKLMML